MRSHCMQVRSCWGFTDLSRPLTLTCQAGHQSTWEDHLGGCLLVHGANMKPFRVESHSTRSSSWYNSLWSRMTFNHVWWLPCVWVFHWRSESLCLRTTEVALIHRQALTLWLDSDCFVKGRCCGNVNRFHICIRMIIRSMCHRQSTLSLKWSRSLSDLHVNNFSKSIFTLTFVDS